MKRIAACLTLFLLASCGSNAPESARSQIPVTDLSGLTLPQPKAATPIFYVELKRPLPEERVKRLERTRGVAIVAPLSVASLEVRGPFGRKKLEVGAVDWVRFRPLAPSATKDADFVWTSLLEGEAFLTYDAADRLGVRDASTLKVGETGEIEIGGFAANGVPNLFDVMVAARQGQALGLTEIDHLVIGAKPGAERENIRKALERVLPGAHFRKLFPEASTSPSAPAAPEAVGQAQGALIGAMTFRILKSGFIDPDDAWVAANIASASVPILGSVTCHRLMLPQLGAALAELESEGLGDRINPGAYGGCYVPRFINRDPRRSLSMHAFGLAVDLNVSTNRYGTAGDMDPSIVAIFQKWGFNWGGYWSPPDPMHFEMARLIQP